MQIESISNENFMALAEMMLALWPECSREDALEDCTYLLDTDQETALLAKDQQAYAGFVQLSLRRDYVEGTDTSPVAYIEGLYVKPEYRRTGVASMLIEKGAEWGRQKGCTEYASDVELHNTDSIAFHQSIGFEEANRIVCFVRKL